MNSSSLSPPLPLALVSGFLGAGKTTLMRRLILSAREQGVRLAVVVNEFGEMDVDTHILREANAELLASVAGGCACCSGQDELQETLLEMAARPATQRPDLVVIEASGLADPVLLLEVLTAPQLLSRVQIRALVSVVDSARYLEMAHSLQGLLRRQVMLADVLIFNKTDLADREQLPLLQAKMRELVPHAEQIFAAQCEFDERLLWPRLLHAASTLSARSASTLNEENAHHHAHSAMHTVWCPLPHPLERSRLEAALQSLPETVWRVKGFVRLRGEAVLQLVQYVGNEGAASRVHCAPFHLPFGSEEPETGLVFIGARLDAKSLLQAFRGAGTMLSVW